MSYLLVFLLSTTLVYWYSHIAIRIGLLDQPNHRTSHEHATPRGGGIVFVFLWLLALVALYVKYHFDTSLFLGLLLPTLLVASVSFLDDYFDLKRRYRIMAHLLTAIIALYFTGDVDLHLGSFHITSSWLLLVGYALYIIWSINLYNFMDGLDGQAGFQSFYIFLVSGLLLIWQGEGLFADLNLLLAFSVLGFLVWNWPKAKVFMGDVGSTSLGLLVAITSIRYQQKISFLVYLILYMPFLFDSTVTLLRRMFAGEPWYEAHNRHAFQRLFQSGWSHQKVLFGLIFIDAISLLIVVGTLYYPDYMYSLFLLDVAIISYFYYAIECINPMQNQVDMVKAV